MSKICIVLATYNGEKYLPQMLDSLCAQTRKTDTIIAVDDGSKDSTLEILESYKDRLPLQITAFEKNCGHRAAFSKCLEIASTQTGDEDFIALADHDDIWLPQKLALLEKAIEEPVDGKKPDLVFGDANVIDGEGNLVEESWRKIENIQEHLSLKALLTGFTNVTGCLVLFRASLLKQVLPIPQGVPVHDQWITLCAAANNGYKAIKEPVIQYRIHGNNAIGQGSSHTWNHRLNVNLQWSTTILATDFYKRLPEDYQKFLQEYIRYLKKRLGKNFVFSYLPWLVKNAKALYPHLHHFYQFVPRILFGIVGVPFATRFMGRK
ncbi:glycosyltransferase [Fibrobacter sp.]|uniref:glycosyltransferase n=1 Tax=Fibrobacter sp. TaxID=35828 RepID=UPI00388DB4D0